MMNHALSKGYKLVLRIDDDILLEKDVIRKMVEAFVADEKVEYAAIGYILLNPSVPKEMQFAPPDYLSRPEFAGTRNPCVLNAQIVLYPDDVTEREAEHLYSSYMYRPELISSVGGYATDLSRVAFREESIPLIELFLAGWKLKYLTKAVGYHFNEPQGGVRSVPEDSRMRMYEGDQRKFEQRLRELEIKYGRR
jgi:GT2 family glycosyltransferase